MANHLELPDKLYFKIGEVARLAGVKQYVLRYWESEFPSIKPIKSKTNQRLYKRRDVEAVLAIKHLLYDRKFTIEGAKKHLKTEGIETALPPPNLDDIAARARERALNEAKDTFEREKAGLMRQNEKQLLSLRKDIAEFLDTLNKN